MISRIIEVDILFSKGPGPDSEFIDVTDKYGAGVGVGTWRELENGWWALRLKVLVEDPNDQYRPPPLWRRLMRRLAR